MISRETQVIYKANFPFKWQRSEAEFKKNIPEVR